MFSTSVPQNSDNLNVRVNQNLTKKDRIAGNVNFQDRSGNNPQLFGFLDETSGRGISTNLSYTRNVGARSINVLTWAFNRNRSNTIPYFAEKRTSPPSSASTASHRIRLITVRPI